MAGRSKNKQIRNINVIDMILIDHKFIKECIELFKNGEGDKQEKLDMARDFLEVLARHSEAEKKIVYGALENKPEFHFNILEAQIEHGIVDEKIKILKSRVSRTKKLNDEMGVELKVLAELVEHHLKDEESELLPKMSAEIDEEILEEMGQLFMTARQMTLKDLREYPQLQDELIQWKDNVQKVSSQFLSKMDKYVENLNH